MEGPDRGDLRKVVFDNDFKSWISPFVMAVINTKVVRRSHALSGYPYGKEFTYDEAVLTGRGMGGKLKGIGGMWALAAMSAGRPGGLYKRMVGRFLPKPGEGPSKSQRESGFFAIKMLGRLADQSVFKCQVKGDRDPGYGSTSKMLGESAVCLALDKETTPDIGGVLTPSTAMGQALLTRLEQNAGLSFVMQD